MAHLGRWKQAASGGPCGQGWRKRHLPDQECTPITGGYVNLFKEWNHIWYNSCKRRHHLVKLLIIDRHSPSSVSLPHRLSKSVEWEDGGNHHPCIFQVLDGGTDLCNPTEMWYYFWFTIFRNRSSSSGFYLAFLTIISVTPQVRNPCGDPAGCWVCQFWLYILEQEKWLQVGFGDPLWDRSDWTLHWSPDLHKPSLWWATATFWVS